MSLTIVDFPTSMRRMAGAALVLATTALLGCSDSTSGTAQVSESTVDNLTKPAALPAGAKPKGKESKLIAPHSIKDLRGRTKTGG